LCEPWGYDGGIAELERILIVGGGIAGLSLATALQRQGFAPAPIERGAAWRPLGAEINLPANGPRVLRRLGLGAAVATASAVIPHWRSSVSKPSRCVPIWKRPGRR
jgi:2-polyprenyl-6-methoxyphenol hydroxylase-like FAD-dependent oxidoreductase